MNAVSRRKIEMGVRALEFSRANPDADAGYGVAAAKLEQLVARAHEAAAAQRSGVVDVRAASARKQELRRAMLRLYRGTKLAVEPAGAASTAALAGPLRDRLRGRRIALIVSGSNLDVPTFARHIAAIDEM